MEIVDKPFVFMSQTENEAKYIEYFTEQTGIEFLSIDITGGFPDMFYLNADIRATISITSRVVIFLSKDTDTTTKLFQIQVNEALQPYNKSNKLNKFRSISIILVPDPVTGYDWFYKNKKQYITGLLSLNRLNLKEKRRTKIKLSDSYINEYTIENFDNFVESDFRALNHLDYRFSFIRKSLSYYDKGTFLMPLPLSQQLPCTNSLKTISAKDLSYKENVTTCLKEYNST